ncbi:uncharacterized protein LOC129984813 [Argiope bruennichi]|uniref:Uncharacterized protein n=1 Tax=Argiope bruennichi TaxID=94029 RepID=A0A8T0EK53_ARGBR|nr:uncharacterized protein LOC129984813 [Argiope bruennichi]KAF8774267.1 hypothetical protein HNY73_016837 [Argiope bruennichi]
MNAVILSAFVGILLVVCVQSQNNNGCNLSCENNEYCNRRVIGKMAFERCMRYRRKGALCNDDFWKCNPEQDCKPRRQGSSLRYCLDRSETTSTTMTMPTTPTMMTTDMPTDMPTGVTDGNTNV